MNKLLIGFSVMMMAGCAQQVGYTKEGGVTQAQFDRDRAQCQYEAAAATAGYSSGGTAPTVSGVAGQAMGDAVAMGLRQNELIRLCLSARGYYLIPVAQ